jgi:hypothetical protein
MCFWVATQCISEAGRRFGRTLFNIEAQAKHGTNSGSFVGLIGDMFHRLLEFLVTDPEVRVRFPALPDFLKFNGSGIKLRSDLEEKVVAPV